MSQLKNLTHESIQYTTELIKMYFKFKAHCNKLVMCFHA